MKKYNYVYKITNLVNNKIYIGKHSTDDINDGYMGSGVRLHQAYKKYGLECFSKEVIDYYTTEVELNQSEIYWIAWFNSTDPKVGYNLTYGGNGGGKTEETRRKMSTAMKGIKRKKPFSEEHRRKLSEAHKGKPSSKKGKPLTEEHRKRLCKPKTEEHRRKISEVRKGIHFSEETKQKMKGRIPWNKGKKLK